ncbi:MAG: aldo/keto reductase [Clostridia bacterium]|nr:aldo/keto reductase [Clostridia bacterium]
MQYRHLPSTGLKVSEICLGTMTFGGQTSAEDSKDIIACALDNGINFIDTANIYTGGNSETILGEALGSRRSDVILATKTGGPRSRVPNNSGLSRKQILASVEESLTRLNTDYIDILYLHFPDKLTPPEEYIERQKPSQILETEI